MPTYDYMCMNCNKVEEVVRIGYERGTPVRCKKCGDRMTRVMGRKAAASIFKGNGWTGARRHG